MEVREISPVVQDYLKAIWQATEWGGRSATTTSLAARFATTPAAVSEKLRRLAADGLLIWEPYRPPALTALGTQLAVAMVRRHRLIETYLVRELGYACTEVHADAERLEHAVSEKFLDRIDAVLGNPDVDPHGDPIPSKAGEIAYPRACPAAEVSPGRYRVIRISDADAGVLAALHAAGIHVGDEVVLAGDPEVRTVARISGELPQILGLAAVAALLVD